MPLHDAVYDTIRTNMVLVVARLQRVTGSAMD